ncbi:MAG TPA: amino acid ABC transporter substrate-binding protein [Firmicutes bacterium]|jgi:polar amino acid transport system substrate-binding protein|nr:amino acid ABC transporter substrate-binding protein [Bacillota bacterium]
MKKGIGFMLALLLVFLLIVSGNAAPKKDTSWEEIAKRGYFVLGLDDSFPPMGFRDDKGQIVGFDIDVAKAVCQRLGIELKLQPINWDAKEQELNTKNIDCIWNGLTITPERKKNVLFTKPYMDNRQVIVVRADSGLASLSALAGKTLGLQAGSSAKDALNNVPDFEASLANVIEFDENMTALMDLELGGLDAVLMDEIVARYYIQQRNKNFMVLDEALASEEYGIGFRKNDQALMEKFQNTLIAMAEDGTLAAISKAWFGEDITVINR